MSFGVSEINPELTTEENVEAVDAKLYYAKEHGRNRVISELPESDPEESNEETEN